MDWSSLYPSFFPSSSGSDEAMSAAKPQVEFADIGCGYGGLLGMLY